MDKTFENLSLWKDIKDIDDMLSQYYKIGLINREKAIAETLPANSVPFSEASDNQLACELNTYRAILKENYFRNMQVNP